MGSLPPLLMAGAASLCLGSVLHIVGLSTVHWMDVSRINVRHEAHIGLFKTCVTKGGSTSCVEISLDDYPSELGDPWKAVIAMTILGMLSSFVGVATAIFTTVFTFLSKTVSSTIRIVCFGASLVAGLLIITGVTVYGVKVYDSDEFKVNSPYFEKTFGYSFILCIVSAVMIPVGGGLVFLEGRSSNLGQRF